MKTSSAKNKGRRLCSHVKERLLHWAPDLKADDVMVPATSTQGEDIWLSPAARATYPLAIECKMQESLNIWAALEQSRTHVGSTDNKPVVIFSRNREGRTYIAMDLEDYLWLTR